MKKIKYSEIYKTLETFNIILKTKLSDETVFNSINSLTNAGENDLTFFTNIKYIETLKNCKAKACIINENYKKYLPKTCVPIIAEDPYFVFAALSDIFSNSKYISTGIISKNININESSIVGKNVQIDDYVTIDYKSEIHDNVIIGSNSNIGPNVVIKKNCIIRNNVSISNAIIEEGCEIKSGVVIGLSGFGFEEKTKKKINHIGNVIINKHSTIGANTTIDRAVFDSTFIGEYSQIDNLVQIAHNVIIGKHAIIAAQAGIAGSTVIGDFVKIGGQAGISGHLKIGNNVTIAAKSGVTKNIVDNKIIAGFPAKDISIWKREIINLNKLK